MKSITRKDRQVLRDFAKTQYEISRSPEMTALKSDWIAHNDGRGERPLVVVELGTFQNDILPPLLRCESEDARRIETLFHLNIANHQLFHDDSPVPDYFPVSFDKWFKPFDIDVGIDRAAGSDDSLGHHFVEVIHDLSTDMGGLKKSTYGGDDTGHRRRMEIYEDIFGDILPVRVSGECLYAVPTQDIVHIMSMENMFLAMYDTPDLFKLLMDRLTDDYLEYFGFLESEGLLLPTNRNETLSQGSFCFTEQLPGDQTSKGVGISEVWGFLDSQETVGVSPEMFKEFVFPYYRKIADRYGALSYGCCEPVHPIWETCLSELSNLRKVSISPWCNEGYMGEQLQGSRIVYHRKPSPNFLGVGSHLDVEGLKQHINQTLHAARGCTIEFTQRDVYSISAGPEKVALYVRTIREECDRNYRR